MSRSVYAGLFLLAATLFIPADGGGQALAAPAPFFKRQPPVRIVPVYGAWTLTIGSSSWHVLLLPGGRYTAKSAWVDSYDYEGTWDLTGDTLTVKERQVGREDGYTFTYKLTRRGNYEFDDSYWKLKR